MIYIFNFMTGRIAMRNLVAINLPIFRRFQNINFLDFRSYKYLAGYISESDRGCTPLNCIFFDLSVHYCTQIALPI